MPDDARAASAKETEEEDLWQTFRTQLGPYLDTAASVQESGIYPSRNTAVGFLKAVLAIVDRSASRGARVGSIRRTLLSAGQILAAGDVEGFYAKAHGILEQFDKVLASMSVIERLAMFQRALKRAEGMGVDTSLPRSTFRQAKPALKAGDSERVEVLLEQAKAQLRECLSAHKPTPPRAEGLVDGSAASSETPAGPPPTKPFAEVSGHKKPRIRIIEPTPDASADQSGPQGRTQPQPWRGGSEPGTVTELGEHDAADGEGPGADRSSELVSRAKMEAYHKIEWLEEQGLRLKPYRVKLYEATHALRQGDESGALQIASEVLNDLRSLEKAAEGWRAARTAFEERKAQLTQLGGKAPPVAISHAEVAKQYAAELSLDAAAREYRAATEMIARIQEGMARFVDARGRFQNLKGRLEAAGRAVPGPVAAQVAEAEGLATAYEPERAAAVMEEGIRALEQLEEKLERIRRLKATVIQRRKVLEDAGFPLPQPLAEKISDADTLASQDDPSLAIQILESTAKDLEALNLRASRLGALKERYTHVKTRLEADGRAVPSQVIGRVVEAETFIVRGDFEAALERYDSALNALDILEAPNGLVEGMTFDTFVVGRCNELAHASALSLAREGPKGSNPYYVYSDVGLGKTHLLNAIGWAMLQGETPRRLRYMTAGDLIAMIVRFLREGTLDQFREDLSSLDALLVDDIQFLSGHERTQEEFFNIFNALYSRGKPIVLASDRPPSEIQGVESRLTSRFAMGFIVDIQPPDVETRLAILERKAKSMGGEVGKDVLRYIAELYPGNVRELQGALNRVLTSAKVLKRSPDLGLAKEVFKDRVAELERAAKPAAAAPAEKVRTEPTGQPQANAAGTAPGRKLEEAELEPGVSYLLKGDPRVAFLIAKRYVEVGKPVLCLTRMNPKHLKSRYRIAPAENTKVLWLSDTSGELAIQPKLERLIDTLDQFAKKNDGIIVLDGLEYLVSKHTFTPTLKFMRELIDAVSMSQSVLLVPVTSEAFDPRDLSTLEREMETLE